ncbi:hypothetical protein [Streptacidiphilus sp. MAP5-3]
MTPSLADSRTAGGSKEHAAATPGGHVRGAEDPACGGCESSPRLTQRV